MLHCDRTADGFDNARKLDEHAVSGDLEDATFVLGDLRVDQLAAQCLEPRQRAGLIPGHKSAVSSDIGREDSGEPPLDPLGPQRALPY